MGRWGLAESPESIDAALRETALELNLSVLLSPFNTILQSATPGMVFCHAAPALHLRPLSCFLSPQVYNEQIHDLLEPKGPLAIREDPDKGVVVQGLSFHQVWGWARAAGAAPGFCHQAVWGSPGSWGGGGSQGVTLVLKSGSPCWGRSPAWGDRSPLPGHLLRSQPQLSSCWTC